MIYYIKQQKKNIMNFIQIGAFAVAGYLTFNYVQKLKAKKLAEKKLAQKKYAESLEDESVSENVEEEAFNRASGKSKVNNWGSTTIAVGL